jgi:serine phosphatase RsbU (regulator of sigma subunit)
MLDATLAEYFVYWEPRDRVGGDAYWCEHWGRGNILALGDCTGHGVPGAFITMIVNGALSMALLETPPGDVAVLLQRTHQLIKSVLSQDTEGGESDDGLEMGICYITPKSNKMVYAGGRFSLFYHENGEVNEVRGDKFGLGYRRVPHDVQFTNQEIEITPDRTFYMTSDGIIDQIGGDKRRSFGKKRFKTLLCEIVDLPMAEQRTRVNQTLVEYQGDEQRRDDVSVIGFRLGERDLASEKPTT